MIICNLLSMGTYFPKSKCADLGRSLRKGASTTCLQARRVPPLAAPALSQSRALDFVWLCLWHFRFRFLRGFAVAAGLLPCLAVNKTDPLPGPPPASTRGLSSTCTVCNALQNIPRIFTCLRAFERSFEMANSAAPRHEQVLWWLEQAWERRHLDARPLKGVRQCADGHELSFSLCHKQKPSVELLG